MQAIKCHVALTSGGKQLPAIEVESQVVLARLLMAHTQNTQEARQRLERAVSPFPSWSMPHAFSTAPYTWAHMRGHKQENYPHRNPLLCLQGVCMFYLSIALSSCAASPGDKDAQGARQQVPGGL